MIRAQKKRQSRQRVVDAARVLFAERGLARTRTAEIASRAGLSHGGMFVHFASRDALLTEVVGQIGRTITDRLHELVAADADLPQVLRAHLQCIQECEATYAALLRESRLLPEDVLRTWVGVQSAIAVHLAEPAQAAMDSGRIHAMPMHLVYNTWVGLVHHYLMNRELFAPETSVIARRGDELIAHFLSMVCVNRPYSSTKTTF